LSRPRSPSEQAYLRFNGINFVTTPSNNHASPNGSLPFILPSVQTPNRPASPVPANKISKWVATQRGQENPLSLEYEVYNSLLDHRIRSAWLYTLYLDESNFYSVAYQLYISSASSDRIVQATLAYDLRKAAREELLKTSNIIDEEDLFDGAEKAFETLSILLGDDETYAEDSQPGLFDASVFAYTHLLLNEQLKWRNTRMSESLKRFGNLVRHQQRLLGFYFQT
jgi:metaxin